MSRILVSANESALTAGIGNSSTVDNARAVRIYNDSGADATLFVTDSNYSGIGSVTLKSGTIEIIEKRPQDYIYYVGSATIKVSRVGIVN
jgi:hypothetical protein